MELETFLSPSTCLMHIDVKLQMYSVKIAVLSVTTVHY